MTINPGSKLGPYEVVAPLGAGGMGEVYRAKDTRLGRDVAIKVLPATLAQNADRLRRFETEAKTIATLNHPNIVSVFDVGTHEGAPFLVSELLEGHTLRDEMGGGALPLRKVVEYGKEIAEGLAAAHEKGIIHRDLKPENVFVVKDGRVKILDFGLAKLATAEAGSDEGMTLEAGSGRTTPGMVLGTVGYMSPEQVRGEAADARSDIFSLGTMLYEMLTGKRAFRKDTSAETMAAILNEEPAELSVVSGPISPGVERIVRRCLEKKPLKRFQSARDLAFNLEGITGGTGASATGMPAQVAEKRPGKMWIWATAAVGLLLAGAAGGWLLTKKEQKWPEFQIVTYRAGELVSARFAADGKTIVYGGRWEGDPLQISTVKLGSPESRPLGIMNATVASVSSQDELAVLSGCSELMLLDCGGTLGTLPLGGGAPREIAREVAYADWGPDGTQLALATISNHGARIEYPVGHVLYEQKAGWIAHPRVSRDGKLVAFECLPEMETDSGSVCVVDMSGTKKELSKGWISLEGLAWSADGKEICVAGTRGGASGWADKVYGIALSGREREILALPQMRLHDISKDGKLLVSKESWGRQLIGMFPGDSAEHPYSWLDDGSPTGISDDGKVFSFIENGEVWALTGEAQGYYRKTDGTGAVHMGSGATAVSPDGKHLILFSQAAKRLVVQPVGAGESVELVTPGLQAFAGVAWSGDGSTIVYEASTEDKGWSTYVQRIDGGQPRLVKKTGRESWPRLSPDGRTIAVRENGGGVGLYGDDGHKIGEVKGAKSDERPVAFTKDGKGLLVVEQIDSELVMTVIDLASGQRKEWRRLKSHFVGSSTISVTPDLKYYVYVRPHYSSTLYLVDGVK